MSNKLLTEHYLESLRSRGGYTGSYESTLVIMPHCWKSHVAAHMLRLHSKCCVFKVYQYIFYFYANLIERINSHVIDY